MRDASSPRRWPVASTANPLRSVSAARGVYVLLIASFSPVARFLLLSLTSLLVRDPSARSTASGLSPAPPHLRTPALPKPVPQRYPPRSPDLCQRGSARRQCAEPCRAGRRPRSP